MKISSQTIQDTTCVKSATFTAASTPQRSLKFRVMIDFMFVIFMFINIQTLDASFFAFNFYFDQMSHHWISKQSINGSLASNHCFKSWWQNILLKFASHLDRFPSAPIIHEGYPKNLTVLENSTVYFECPILSDLGVHIEWAKFHNNNTDTAIPKNVTKLEVSMNTLIPSRWRRIDSIYFVTGFIIFLSTSHMLLVLIFI